MAQKKNISKALYELTSKAQMQQSIYAALRNLDEWEYTGNCVPAAITLLRTAAREIGNEIEQLQEFVNGGELDTDEALKKPMEYEE